MGGRFAGILIKRERLRKSWSQEGLCGGICAVSYLSKIEQNKTAASREVLRLLLRRLDVNWYDGEAVCDKASKLADRAYDALFSSDKTALEAAGREMAEQWEVLSHCPYLLDFLLLRGMIADSDAPELGEFVSCFDERQQILWMLLQKRYEDALRLKPSAYTYLVAGWASYDDGNYPIALERLQRSYDLAGERGYVYIMLESRLLIGNCHSNTMEFDRMQEHYKVAERLAAALGDKAVLDQICYNTQSTNLELGKFQESYDYFSKRENPNAMDLHKLAICCEKLGKTGEAAEALNRAETTAADFPPRDLIRLMCRLVRYRLEHREYLKEMAYGRMLLSCFQRLRKELPSGYAGFHLPWVMEWYTAARQYKQAYELMRDFPENKALRRF